MKEMEAIARVSPLYQLSPPFFHFPLQLKTQYPKPSDLPSETSVYDVTVNEDHFPTLPTLTNEI